MRSEVFTHGQLYVACSRVGSPESLRFALNTDNRDKVRNTEIHREERDKKTMTKTEGGRGV